MWPGSGAPKYALMKLLLSGCLASFTLFAQQPFFRADDVTSSASYSSFPGVSAGQLVTIFGGNLGPPFGVVAKPDARTGKLPTSLGGTVVTFDNIRAPLLFVSDSQINLQVPYELAGRTITNVVVRFAIWTSSPARIRILPVNPGIFTQDYTNQAVALNQDGNLNSPWNPAGIGSMITIYATGLGQVIPNAETGRPAPSRPPSTLDRFDVFIGGARATVFFAGLVPGQIGLYQIVATVPAVRVPTLETSVIIGTQTSASQRNVTLAVR